MNQLHRIIKILNHRLKDGFQQIIRGCWIRMSTILRIQQPLITWWKPHLLNGDSQF